MTQTEGALLRRAREAQRMTVKEAAAAANMSHQNWSRYEQGRAANIPDGTLAHAAHAVGVLPDELEAIDRNEAAEILRMVYRRLAGPPNGDDDIAQELADLREAMIARIQEMEERIQQRRHDSSGQQRQSRQSDGGGKEGRSADWSEINRKAQ